MLGRADVTGCVEAMRGAFPGMPERTLAQFSADWRYDFKRRAREKHLPPTRAAHRTPSCAGLC